MTGSKCKPHVDDEVRRALARARRFLANNGIDFAAIVHREDAARLMMEFAKTRRGVFGADEDGAEGNAGETRCTAKTRNIKATPALFCKRF